MVVNLHHAPRFGESNVEWGPQVKQKHQRGRRNAQTRAARAERQARLARTAPVPAAPKATAPATVAETAAPTADELPPGWHAYIFKSHAPREMFNPARTANVVRDDGNFVVIEARSRGEQK